MKMGAGLLCLFTACNWTSRADQFTINEGDIEMVNIRNFPRETLIGGDVADPSAYPANFYTSQGNSRCSGTILGNKVLSTAAHCVGNGRTATLNYNGETFTGTCTHHPDYRGNSTADWALCVLSKELPVLPYEKMIPDVSVIKVNDEVELTGFGCTDSSGNGGNDGKFRVGKAKVNRIPAGSSHDIITVGAALCFGDSGGSPYYYVGAERWQFGNNSRGDIRTTSYLSSFTPTMQTWARQWATEKAVKICGMHPDATGCRNAEPPPPPSPCKLAYTKLGKCLFEGEARSQTQLCRDNYATLFACLEEAERSE